MLEKFNESFCNKCNRKLPIIMFSKDKTKKSGHSNYCKECMKKYFKQRYNNKKEELLQKCKKNYQKNKEKIKQRNKKYKDAHHDYYINYLKNYYNTNKEQLREQQKQYYNKNKEQYKKSNKTYRILNRSKIINRQCDWYFNNRIRLLEKAKINGKKYRQTLNGKKVSMRSHIKRRAVKKNAKHEDWMDYYQEIKSKDTIICYWCGKKTKTDSKHCHFDHIIPLDKGGPDIKSNIAPTCSKCNISHSNKMPDEYLKWRLKYNLPINPKRILNITASVWPYAWSS